MVLKCPSPNTGTHTLLFSSRQALPIYSQGTVTTTLWLHLTVSFHSQGGEKLTHCDYITLLCNLLYCILMYANTTCNNKGDYCFGIEETIYRLNHFTLHVDKCNLGKVNLKTMPAIHILVMFIVIRNLFDKFQLLRLADNPQQDWIPISPRNTLLDGP